jgi:hypothetical protein
MLTIKEKESTKQPGEIQQSKTETIRTIKKTTYSKEKKAI